MILRVQKNENYTTINNTGLNDTRLSWGAKGLLTYLISKPNNWQIYLNHLSTQSKDGREATSNRLKELIKYEYISKKQLRNKEGQFIENEWIVSEIPFTENPFTENQPLVNTEKVNTEKVNTEKEKDNRVNSEDGLKNPSNFSKRDIINKSLKKNIFKKEIKYFLNIKDTIPIVRKSLIKFKKIIISIHPKVKKDGLTCSKEINQVKDRIKCFMNGFPKNKYTSLDSNWCNEHNIPPEILKSGFSSEVYFIEALNRALNIYKSGFKPDDKSGLPTRLSDFFYNSNRKLKSYFLFYSFNPPKKINEIKPLKDELPEMTEYYEEQFFKKKLDIDIKEKNQLIKECKKIREYYNDCVNRNIKLKNGEKKKVKEVLYHLSNYGAPMSDIKYFVKCHVEWLNGVLLSKDNKIPHINFMKCGNGFWRSFIDWMKIEYGVDIEMLFDDEKVIREKIIRYS